MFVGLIPKEQHFTFSQFNNYFWWEVLFTWLNKSENKIDKEAFNLDLPFLQPLFIHF